MARERKSRFRTFLLLRTNKSTENNTPLWKVLVLGYVLCCANFFSHCIRKQVKQTKRKNLWGIESFTFFYFFSLFFKHIKYNLTAIIIPWVNIEVKHIFLVGILCGRFVLGLSFLSLTLAHFSKCILFCRWHVITLKRLWKYLCSSVNPCVTIFLSFFFCWIAPTLIYIWKQRSENEKNKRTNESK